MARARSERARNSKIHLQGSSVHIPGLKRHLDGRARKLCRWVVRGRSDRTSNVMHLGESSLGFGGLSQENFVPKGGLISLANCSGQFIGNFQASTGETRFQANSQGVSIEHSYKRNKEASQLASFNAASFF